MLYSRLPDYLRHIHSRGPKWIGATGNTQHAKGKHSQTTNHANSHVPMGPNGSNTDLNERSPHGHATVRSRLKYATSTHQYQSQQNATSTHQRLSQKYATESFYDRFMLKHKPLWQEDKPPTSIPDQQGEMND